MEKNYFWRERERVRQQVELKQAQLAASQQQQFLLQQHCEQVRESDRTKAQVMHLFSGITHTQSIIAQQYVYKMRRIEEDLYRIQFQITRLQAELDAYVLQLEYFEHELQRIEILLSSL